MAPNTCCCIGNSFSQAVSDPKIVGGAFSGLIWFVVVVAIVLCLLPGCGGGYSAVQQEQRVAWRQEQARLCDIPVPIMAEPDFTYAWQKDSSDNRVIGYTVSSVEDYGDLVEFYQTNMERLGWHERAVIKGHETLLLFEKPEKLCCVSIRPTGNKVQLVLSLGALEDAEYV